MTGKIGGKNASTKRKSSDKKTGYTEDLAEKDDRGHGCFQPSPNPILVLFAPLLQHRKPHRPLA